MAADYFLRINGINGESKDDKHKGEIDVLAWSWGESNSGTVHAGTGGGAGKVAFQDLSFTMRVSKASPALFLACASGQHFKDAKLTGRKAGKDQLEYLSWTFSDILVTSYQTGGSEGEDSQMENVTLNFSKAQVSYKAQKADGTPDTPINAGWDIKTNTKV
jgi:type VI secretion system secreted protein Hcp